MLRKVQKGIEHCYYQTLRDVLKVEGDKMMKVVANYWKVKFKLQEKRWFKHSIVLPEEKEIHITQCLCFLKVYQGGEVKKQETEVSQTKVDKTLEARIISEDRIGHN